MPHLTNQRRKKLYSLKSLFWLLAILIGALQAWSDRYIIASEDTISYLDIADAYLRGDWNTAINANWSPLYSWLLGLTLFVLKPSPFWEFPVVKLTNFLIYVFALICFEFFLQELIYSYNKKIIQDSPNSSFKIPEWAWVVSGYSLFLLSSLKFIGVYCDTPDMCTAALIYLGSGIVLRIHTRSASWFNFIMLGVVLGFAYLSKAVMFSLAFVFLVVAMLSVGNLRRALPRVLVALLVFTIVSAPFIVALSTAKGRLTYSDTGKLSYVWYINPGRSVINDIHWQGGPAGYGTPKHPTRKIFDAPPAFEFATPIGGTYPPWYDPSYWYEGLTIKFNLIKQLKVLAKNTIFYYKQFLVTLLFGYLILVYVGGRFRPSLKGLAENWKLLIPSLAGLGIYMVVTDFQVNSYYMQPSTRFIAPFILLLFAGCFSSVRLSDSQQSKRLIAALTLTTLVIIGSQLSVQAAKDLVAVVRKPEHVQWQLAEGLHQLKIQPGERVAILGDEYDHMFWARLARTKIVAQITDAKSFWEKDAVVRSEIFRTIEEKTGVRVVVYKPVSEQPDFTGWQRVGNTDYYAYFFS